MSLCGLLLPFAHAAAQEEQADGLVLTNRRADCSELSPYASHNSMLNVYSSPRFLLITPIFMACKSQYWSSKDEQMTKTIRMQLEEKMWGLHGPFKLTLMLFPNKMHNISQCVLFPLFSLPLNMKRFKWDPGVSSSTVGKSGKAESRNMGTVNIGQEEQSSQDQKCRKNAIVRE